MSVITRSNSCTRAAAIAEATIGYELRLIAGFFEEGDDERPHHGLVIDDENPLCSHQLNVRDSSTDFIGPIRSFLDRQWHSGPRRG